MFTLQAYTKLSRILIAYIQGQPLFSSSLAYYTNPLTNYSRLGIQAHNSDVLTERLCKPDSHRVVDSWLYLNIALHRGNCPLPFTSASVTVVDIILKRTYAVHVQNEKRNLTITVSVNFNIHEVF